MFGGLIKTSSRIAIAAALGVVVGGYALSTPAKAGGLGGDCCADLEERVAELEATTVRKGNKKVSVTISGWVIKSMNWWDDGANGNFYVGDKDGDLGSRFAITGSATIAPGWSAGYNLTVLAPSNVWGIASNQFVENAAGGVGAISTLYSYIFVKSDNYGTLNWGYLSPASDNAAVLADISGTVIESNGVQFEGPGFFLRPSGGAALSGLTWGTFNNCIGLGAGIGVDCWGVPNPAVRYDSPTFGGFRLETSYGTNELTLPRAPGVLTAAESNFWDIAVFYNENWGNFKVSAAYSYTWIETAASFVGRAAAGTARNGEADLHQVGATLLHEPSGLGIYGLYQYEESNALVLNTATGLFEGVPDTDAYYIKPFIQGNWNAAGKTIVFGEWGQYNDQFAGIAGLGQCGAFTSGTGVGGFCGAAAGNTVLVRGSEFETFGAGVVQEIDAAAMHLWLRWRYFDVDVDFVGFDATGASTGAVGQSFENWNMFQAGGIIFF